MVSRCTEIFPVTECGLSRYGLLHFSYCPFGRRNIFWKQTRKLKTVCFVLFSNNFPLFLDGMRKSRGEDFLHKGSDPPSKLSGKQIQRRNQRTVRPYTPSKQTGPALLVSVLTARNLRASDVETGKSDPVCFLRFKNPHFKFAQGQLAVPGAVAAASSLGSRVGVSEEGLVFAYTDCKNETINPEWNETFRFPLKALFPSPLDDNQIVHCLSNVELRVCVKDEDVIDKNGLRVPISEEIASYRDEDGAVSHVSAGRKLDLGLEKHRMQLAEALARQEQLHPSEAHAQEDNLPDYLVNGAAIQYDGLGTVFSKGTFSFFMVSIVLMTS
jgi:hypothetical protein